MSKGASSNSKQVVGGIDFVDVTTAEADQPAAYFAGTRALSGSSIMPAVISHIKDGSSSGKGGKGGGGSGVKDFYGHAAWELCQGQIDSIWGLMVDNQLVWPEAQSWDAGIYPANKTVIYTDGNVYTTTAKTNIDPPTFPWTMLAIPWVAGTTTAGNDVLYAGQVWQARVNTTTTPPSTTADPTLPVQPAPSLGDWKYVCTPEDWSGGIPSTFWPANSIVAHEGRLYTTPSGTKATPPASPWVLFKLDLSGNPTHLTVTNAQTGQSGSGAGDWYLYKGTATQTLDTGGEAILSALGHPPYRNRAVLVAKNVKFGSSMTNPPTPRLLAIRKPVQSLITGSATDLDADWQANPWCVLAELLTHPIYGLGLASSWFDATTWQAEADRCAANPQLHYISPMITSLKNVRDIVAELLSYPDAFVFWSVVGTLLAGHWPHGEAGPTFNTANTINRDVMISEPAWSSDLWAGTDNSVEVAFDDIQAGFKNRPVPASNLFNMAITRRVLSTKVDRPFIVRSAQAAAWASEFSKVMADQTIASSRVTCRAERRH